MRLSYRKANGLPADNRAVGLNGVMGNLFASVQSVFFLGIIVVLAYLIVDGLTTRSVWVKGARGWGVDIHTWAQKRSRTDEPLSYWLAMSFYAASLALLSYQALFAQS